MKKTIKILALACAAALMLTACGKEETPPVNPTQTSAGSTVSTPNNSKPDTASTPAATSAPIEVSTPDTPSTPEAPEEIDWSTVPYVDEFDIMVEKVDGGVKINKYLGKDGVVNIPPTIDGEKVTSVNFRENQTITDINIPDSVTEIGADAFSGCKSLTGINIPDSVTEIGGAAFAGCTSLTSINIPDGVPYIGVSAFRGCTSLTSINIPDSVTEIGKLAFDGCTILTSVTFPDSLEWIGASVFTDCPNIKVKYKGKEYDYDHLDSLYSDINGN